MLPPVFSTFWLGMWEPLCRELMPGTRRRGHFPAIPVQSQYQIPGRSWMPPYRAVVMWYVQFSFPPALNTQYCGQNKAHTGNAENQTPRSIGNTLTCPIEKGVAHLSLRKPLCCSPPHQDLQSIAEHAINDATLGQRDLYS